MTENLKPHEQRMEQYAKETRNAVVFLAVAIGVLVVIGFILAIITGVELAHIQHAILNGNSIMNNDIDGLGGLGG